MSNKCIEEEIQINIYRDIYIHTHLIYMCNLTNNPSVPLPRIPPGEPHLCTQKTLYICRFKLNIRNFIWFNLIKGCIL